MSNRVEWTDEMSVGIDTIDADHKRLIELLNSYMDAVDNDEGAFVFTDIFHGFLDYTAYHFAREEDIMAAAQYGGLKAHHQSHMDIIEQLEFMHENVMMSVSAELQDAEREFFQNWLRKHIQIEDQAYSKTVRDYLDAVA